MNILVLNCGSSSIKFAMIQLPSHDQALCGQIEKIGSAETVFKVSLGEKKESRSLGPMDQSTSLNFLLKTYLKERLQELEIHGIGHRVVHGGEAFRGSTLIDDDVIRGIRDCCGLAPLHNPANLFCIELAMEAFPDLPQVAVFDTAFHQTIPEKAFRYAVPDDWYKEYGIRRYGFHGSSHRYVSRQFADVLNKNLSEIQIITVHLGNGSSATAVKLGKSVDTTMGFTPLEGLVMGTRSGDVDPGVFSYLHEQKGWALNDIHNALNNESGLLGLSKVSSDMQELERQKNDPMVRIALDVLCYRLAKNIMALSASLDRLDAIVFTGGIGENSSQTRWETCSHLKVLGIALDQELNIEHGEKNKGVISRSHSPFVCVIPTDEELMIAIDTGSLI
jgi:acetate kinase